MNKKLTKWIVLALIMVVTLVTLAGCGKTAEDKKTDALEGLAVYTQDEDMTDYTKCTEMEGVEFYYPAGYVSVGKTTQPMYMDPEILGASVNLVSSEFSSAFTFEGYIDASILGVKNQMSVEGDIQKEYINLNGQKAAKLTYTATSEGQKMTLTQVVIVKGDKAYILTLGSLVQDAEKFAPKAEKMVKSFK